MFVVTTVFNEGLLRPIYVQDQDKILWLNTG